MDRNRRTCRRRSIVASMDALPPDGPSQPRRPSQARRRRPRRPGGTLRDAERRALARRSRADEREAPVAPGWALLRCDGGSRGNPGPAAYGYVIEDAGGATLAEGSGSLGVATASSAEYRALVAGLRRTLALGLRRVEARVDSRLLVAQLEGERPLRNPALRSLAREVAELRAATGTVRVRWVPSAANGRADALVQHALRDASGGDGAAAP
jgi:ribonuclease HI